MNRMLLALGSVGALLVAAPSANAETAGHAVTQVAAVTSRDGAGRAQRFVDSRDREFIVKYDLEHRVQSVEAARGPHISDIVRIGYAPSGKLVGVRFRTGYTLFFDERPNGTKVIRDSLGGALIRSGRTSQPLDNTGDEQSAKLAAVVAELESMLSALGQDGALFR